MTGTRRIVVKSAVVAAALAAVGWLFVRSVLETNRGPYDVPAEGLTGWTVDAGGPGEPGVVSLLPPAALHAELFRQLFQRTAQSLTAPGRPAVPLVLRDEFADSLQGAITVEQIVQVARAAGLDRASFEPVCMGHRTEKSGGGSSEMFYAIFESPAFTEVRRQLIPTHPEHAGTTPFQPTALRPILLVGAGDASFARWWPMSAEQQRDCEAPLRLAP